MCTHKLLAGVSTLALSLLLANSAVAADLGDLPAAVPAPEASTPSTGLASTLVAKLVMRLAMRTIPLVMVHPATIRALTVS